MNLSCTFHNKSLAAPSWCFILVSVHLLQRLSSSINTLLQEREENSGLAEVKGHSLTNTCQQRLWFLTLIELLFVVQ